MIGTLTFVVVPAPTGKIRRTLGVQLPGESHTLARVFMAVPAPKLRVLPTGGGAAIDAEASRSTILRLNLENMTGPIDIEFVLEAEFADEGPPWGSGTITARVSGMPPVSREFGFGGAIDDALRLQFEVTSSERAHFDHGR